jgi:tetratricopeptide (TPR) repeat protein
MFTVLSIALALAPVTLADVGAKAGAWVSGRPPECAADAGRSAYNVWERAKSPELRRYCDLIAGAASKLAGTSAMAQAALDLAREADALVPDHAAPMILEGRALAALGQSGPALAALRAGKARDGGALDDPPALLAWARALARGGDAREAIDAYRALLPRTGTLSGADRTSAAVEAGLVAMASGAAGLDDAIAALREAARQTQDDTQTVAVLGLILALDRRGEGDEARALLADRTRGDPRNALAAGRAKELVTFAPAEAFAMIALALEASDASGARDAWGQYLEAVPAGPWAPHARAHLAALGGKRAPPARSR